MTERKDNSTSPLISVVVPCYNEAQILPDLHEHLRAAADSWDMEYEVVLVDDGSTDGTWSLLTKFHKQDSRWKALRFARNFGHQAAVTAGLHHANGDCVVVIDADLQDPPEEIARFVAKWREGYEVVYAIRAKRKEALLKRACYRLFYRILGALAHVQIPPDAGDFCLMDRKVVDVLNAMPEQDRFVRGLRAWAGFRQVGLEYDRPARAGGREKYGFRKLTKLALSGIVSFSIVPLQIATWLGLLISGLAFVGVVLHLIQRIFRDFFESIGHAPPPGFATTVISILFLGGVQLICLGIIGEYIGRIYEEVKRRPLWVERERVGLGSR